MVERTCQSIGPVTAALAPIAVGASDAVRLPADRLLGDTLLLLIRP
jgi:hypothetical protein